MTDMKQVNAIAKSMGSSGVAVEPIYKVVGQNIARAREARGLTIEELAEEVGMGVSSIAEIEGADTRLMMHDVEAIAKALGVLPRTIMQGVWF